MKKKVVSYFKKNAGASLKARDIAKKLNISDDHDYSALKSVLHQLQEEGFLTRTGKRYSFGILPELNQVTGRLEYNPGGFGFVIPGNSRMGDIFVANRNLGTAFHGDIVEVSLFASRKKGKNLEGQIVKVIKRHRDEIVGTVNKTKSFYFVKPDDPLIHRDIYISKANLKEAGEGEKVLVGNITWHSPMLNPEGEILELFGMAGSRKAEIVSIAKEFNLPYSFPEEVMRESEQIPATITDAEILKRTDFRSKIVFTIDPLDAKDFDDALSIEETDDGNYKIGIHIADVSHYVKTKSVLDEEAFKRGNSVYLVGSVIPMLPEILSNNICSLVPGKDRLTYSVIVNMNKRGKLIDYRIEKTIINSKRRFNYDEVQDILDSGEGDFVDDLLKLNNLAKTLRSKRIREGSIDFFTPEVKFELDSTGKPLNIYIKEIRQSNMLIEEFMLMANKIVAQHISSAGKKNTLPFVYRIHDLPDSEKVEEFARFVKSLGYSFDISAATNPKQFQSIINQAKGKEEEAVVNELAIRSMAKAVYSPDNIGHFGLGFKYYTHFTSPIRRFADLIVHRLLFHYLENGGGQLYSYKKLGEISEHISGCERSAVEAERQSIKDKQIEYLKVHLGREFHAVVSGVTHFGIFVKVTDILAEGLIRLRDMEGDFYVYDEKKYSLIGRATKKQIRLGDKLNVRLVRVDEEKSELDFIILE